MKVWLARLLIGIVFFFNLQCAIAFLLSPEAFVSAYELSGAVGAAVIQGFGVLFLMWNVPYAVALWHPVRFRTSLWQAVAMQALGVVGELLIYGSLPSDHRYLRQAIVRFAAFDGIGLLLLMMAVLLRNGSRKLSSYK